MKKEDIEKFKKRLEDEKAQLEKELATVGRINPDNPGDWEAVPENDGQQSADLNALSSEIEEYETNTAILKQLETQLLDVNNALKKIEEGRYGICEESGEEISLERLEANPAARTCRSHMEE